MSGFDLFPFKHGSWWRYRDKNNTDFVIKVIDNLDYDEHVHFKFSQSYIAPLAGIHRGQLMLMDVVKLGFANLVQPQPILVINSNIEVGQRYNVLRINGNDNITLIHQVVAQADIRTPGGEINQCYHIMVECNNKPWLSCWVAKGIGIVVWKNCISNGQFVDYGIS